MLSYITKCRMRDHVTGQECGKEVVKAGAIDIPIIGEEPTLKTARVIEGLWEHLKKRHPHEFQLAKNIGMQFTAWLVLRSFTTEDPNLVAIQEQIRAHHFAELRKNYMTDEQIEELVSKLDTPEQRAPYVAIMKELRDALTETGKYAPQQQPTLVPA